MLIAQNLAKSYQQRQVVSDVSVAIDRGEIVGLLGPNGAGKTTCFYMVVGLVAADGGSVSIDGTDVTRLPIHRRAHHGLGYLPQDSSIFQTLSVEDNIMAILQTRRELSATERGQKLESLLDEFSIGHIRANLGRSLSGGERRRTEIARTLATDPSYILLDEPFAGVDPISVNDIKQVIEQLRARGLGVLLTDHNVRETLEIVDRAYILHDGKVLMSGSPDEVVRNENVRRVYLGDSFRIG